MWRFGKGQPRHAYVLVRGGELTDDLWPQKVTAFITAHRPYIQRFSCDIPSSVDYPEAVEGDVAYLRSLPTTSTEPGGYAVTGILGIDDIQSWKSFAAIAPYVYDATAWGKGGVSLELADESESVVTYLRDRSEMLRDIGSQFELRQTE